MVARLPTERTNRGEFATQHNFAIALHANAIDPIVSVRVKSTVGAAICIEPRDVVPRRSADARELAANQNFAIRLEGDCIHEVICEGKESAV